MLHSFRLKIGLLSLCLSGLLLLGFGLFAVSALNRVGRERVDRELRALADAQIRKDQPPGHWRRFEDSLRAIYGEDTSKQFAVKVTLLSGEALYATAEWPEGLPRQSLPLALDAAPDSVDNPTPDRERPPPDRDLDRRPPRPPDERPPRRVGGRPPRPDEPPPPPRRMQHVRGPVYETKGAAGSEWRVMTMANEELTLSIAMSLAGLRAEVRRFQGILLAAVLLGLVLVAAGGWLIGHLALRPVNLIARTAESLTARRLNERIPDTDADDEFRRLIELINGMLERIERSFRQATRFSADAAHELKTPLAILQAQIERALQRAADGSPEQRECAEQLDEVQRLKTILRKLLLLSEADAGQMPLSLERMDLAGMLRVIAEDVKMIAPGRKITVHAPAEVPVLGDVDLLNQAIENLVSNAVKFGDREGVIDMALAARAGQAIFTISNTGRPIPAQDHGKVFDRFYRADRARSREVEGSGLGLSLAREIVRAHGGELTLERSDEQGTTFALTLPLAAADAPSQSGGSRS